MSERSNEQGRSEADTVTRSASDLPALAKKLREAAEKLPPHLRDDALSAADKIHEHASAEAPHAPTIRSHLTGLASIAELTPAVNAILQALSSVGL